MLKVRENTPLYSVINWPQALFVSYASVQSVSPCERLVSSLDRFCSYYAQVFFMSTRKAVRYSVDIRLNTLQCSYHEQGWHSGTVTALASHQHDPGSIPGLYMWVEFVVGSRPCSERFFSGHSGFPFYSKTSISKFQFDLEIVPILLSAFDHLVK